MKSLWKDVFIGENCPALRAPDFCHEIQSVCAMRKPID